MNELTRGHIALMARIRAAVVARVGLNWQSLPGYDRKDVARWLEMTLPVVEAGQRKAVAATDAYLGRAMNRSALGVNPDNLIGAGVRNGTPPADVYTRPFITMWSSLGSGNQWQDAFNAALARAQGSAAMDTQLSMRATADAVNAADPGMYGFVRVADGGACDFCSEIDGAYVLFGDAMALHNNCGCSLEPNTEVHPRAVNLPSGAQIRDYQGGPLINTPPPSGVAIYDHGELGAVLGSPDDHFTTEAQIAN